MDIVSRINKGARAVPTWTIYLAGFVWSAWLLWQATTGGLGADPVKGLERSLGELGLQLLVLGLAITPLRSSSVYVDGGWPFGSKCLTCAGGCPTAAPCACAAPSLKAIGASNAAAVLAAIIHLLWGRRVVMANSSFRAMRKASYWHDRRPDRRSGCLSFGIDRRVRVANEAAAIPPPAQTRCWPAAHCWKRAYAVHAARLHARR